MHKPLSVILATSLLAACGGGAPQPSSSSQQAMSSSSSVPSSEATISSVAQSSSSVAPSSSSVALSSSSIASSSSVAVSSSSIAVSSSSIASSSSAAALKTIFAINVGATESATLKGITYVPEGDLKPIVAGADNGNGVTTKDIAGTTEDKLYQSQRYGLYTYQLPVSQSKYNLTLHFAESFAEAAGTRIISVVAEGKVVMANVDLYDSYGAFKAIEVSLNDIEVNDGSLTIEFTAAANLATLSGILVTSANGKAGEVVAPPKPCAGTGNYVCLDFEKSNPAGITFGSTAKIVTDVAKNGKGSLHFYTNNKNDGKASYYSGFIKTTDSVPGTHWGRMYYRFDTILSPASITHISLMAANQPTTDVRLVDIVRNSNGMHQYLYNFPDDNGGKPSAYNWSFDKSWVCVEWHVDSTTQIYEFYRAGVRVDSISGSVAGDHGGIPANYAWLGFGGQVYQNGPEISGWIDDIVVCPKRSPCQ